MGLKYYKGAKIFQQNRLLENKILVVKKNKTVDIISLDELPKNAPVKILDDGILCPGFVETQANGGGGVLINNDFSHQGIEKVIAAHRKFGTVAMLPTFITDAQDKYHQAIESIATGVKKGIKGLIGGHFEGPFLNPEKKGTHNPKYIREPDQTDLDCYKKYAEYLQNSLISLAPEYLKRGTIANIKPMIPQINMAHSMATHSDLLRAKKEGLTGITHLFNAMRPMSSRDPGPIGSAAELGLSCGIIVDGIHVHPYSLSSVYKAIGKDLLMLVTDSMHTIGVEGVEVFDLMGVTVFFKNNRLVNENGNLAGAHVTLLQSVKNAVKYMHADIESALIMAITTPANYVGRPDLSNITDRETNDVIYLNADLNLCDWQ